jgi:hypothetical protein
MKLQVKDSGAWRNVLVFDAARAAAVEEAAASLLRAAGGSGTAMRISDGDLVKTRCEQPACVWKAARVVCTMPPPGWHCTRERGHDVPCAAQPAVGEHDHSEGGHHD